MLNDLYYDLRDKFDLLIVSDEIGKSKPASLFFLAKFGCLLEKVVFYSESTKNRLWDEVDILITANPNILKNHPEDKIIIKYKTNYNKDINCEFEISTLSDFILLLNKINKEYVQNF
jgi:FMN phosphatase YigB (HAD superfamily)